MTRLDLLLEPSVVVLPRDEAEELLELVDDQSDVELIRNLTTRIERFRDFLANRLQFWVSATFLMLLILFLFRVMALVVVLGIPLWILFQILFMLVVVMPLRVGEGWHIFRLLERVADQSIQIKDGDAVLFGEQLGLSFLAAVSESDDRELDLHVEGEPGAVEGGDGRVVEFDESSDSVAQEVVVQELAFIAGLLSFRLFLQDPLMEAVQIVEEFQLVDLGVGELEGLVGCGA